MRLKHYPIKKLKKEILEILAKHLDLSLYKVFFFGSRAAGLGTERSDIDIGIEGPKRASDEAMLKIQEELENFPALYKIEIVDFKRAAPIFKKVALKHIKLISKPKHDKISSDN